jgi:hypothetical protein
LARLWAQNGSAHSTNNVTGQTGNLVDKFIPVSNLGPETCSFTARGVLDLPIFEKFLLNLEEFNVNYQQKRFPEYGSSLLILNCIDITENA